jgi:ABC-type lipoprotein export system ATPase subunit
MNGETLAMKGILLIHKFFHLLMSLSNHESLYLGLLLRNQSESDEKKAEAYALAKKVRNVSHLILILNREWLLT